MKRHSSAAPRVTARERTVLSPWVTVIARTIVRGDSANEAVYHALELPDYVSVLAATDDGRIVLVRQYRPALEDFSTELPGGLLDPGEEPAICAQRELLEETGYMCNELVPLGIYAPDTGRLGNRLWGYFAPNCRPATGWRSEEEVELLLVSKVDFLRDVAEARFAHALHVALVGTALARGLI
jgi:ADP-ribose pyrophosphatase